MNSSPGSTGATTGRTWIDPALAMILALLTFGHALVYADRTPTGVPPDEWAHITHVHEVASGDRLLPDYANSRVLPNEVKGNYLGHPPLYYSAMGMLGRIAGWDAVEDVRNYRAASAALVAIGLLLWLLIARSLGIGRAWAIPICLSVNAIPMFPYLAGSVNNDALAYLAVAIAIFGVVRIPRWPRAAYYLGAAGLLAALLTKATAALFLLLFFAAWLGWQVRAGTSPIRNRHFLVALGMVAVFSGAYYLYALGTFGTPFPRVGEAHARTGLPQDPMHVLGVFVQFSKEMIERLSMISSHASTVPVTGWLRDLFLLGLALPLVAWIASRWLGRRQPRDSLDDAFMLALGLTVLVHAFVVWRSYQVYGVIAGVQPRYYAYALPGLFVMGFRHYRGHLFTRVLLAAFVAVWLILLLLVPSRSIRTEAARHAPAPATPAIQWTIPAADRRQEVAVRFHRLPAGHVDRLSSDAGTLHVKGWAIDAASKDAAAAVHVYYDGIRVGSVPTGRPRADVAKALDHHGADRAGFEFKVLGLPVTASPCDIDLAAEQSDGRLAILRHGSCPDPVVK